MGYSASRHYFGGTAPVFPLNGAPMHVVLRNGRMAGSWRHRLARRSAGPGCELDVRLFTALAGSGDGAMNQALDQAWRGTGISGHADIPSVRGPLLNRCTGEG